MKGILLRVGADQTDAGGRWNAPVDPQTWRYAYVPIAANEDEHEHIVPCPTFARFQTQVAALDVSLPPHLNGNTKVHLDPDFDSLTYGEPYLSSNGRRASRGRLIESLQKDDFIAFFAGFRPTRPSYEHTLAYCLFGIFFVQRVCQVKELTRAQRAACAHGRRRGAVDDFVVQADPRRSGRFVRALPIGEFRNNAYRVRRDLLETWGGLSVRDGYIQRSAQPPRFNQPARFLDWLAQQTDGERLLQENVDRSHDQEEQT